MRKTLIVAALFGLTATAALAQTASGVDPATGARPGHTPGVGESLPLSSSESNVAGTTPSSDIAATLPAPALGDNAAPLDYVKAARAALVAGQTGLAQQSLEMAETRALDRSVAADAGGAPSQNALVAHIHDALLALGGGNKAQTIKMIDIALAG
jgi:hypothetical protein